MSRHVALLRAINVGGHTVKMDALRDLFLALDLANVSTFIASGNVLFDAAGTDAALERRIEAHLEKALGYEVVTFVRTAGELAAVTAHRPFPAAAIEAAFGLMILFLKAAPPAAAVERLLAYRRDSDDFAVHGREAYWLRRTQQSETKFTAATLERALGGPATARSITTVRKLAALSAGTEG